MRDINTDRYDGEKITNTVGTNNIMYSLSFLFPSLIQFDFIPKQLKVSKHAYLIYVMIL